MQNGLDASSWSADEQAAREIGARLEAGTVWINKHGAIRPDTPFGGVKALGLGVEVDRQGLEEYITIQVIAPHAYSDVSLISGSRVSVCRPGICQF